MRGATIASWPKRPNKADFNPRAPCGARQTGKKEGTTPKKFQSTRPVRGATVVSVAASGTAPVFQSTRPVRGATLHHAAPPSDPLFQSTRPVRGATSNSPHLKTPKTISIHAPRAGRDTARLPPICSASNFNPRAPCGARRRPAPKAPKQTRHFNPRAPCGARPSFITPSSQQSLFQSTRPVRGATRTQGRRFPCSTHFNPRAPCGARQILNAISKNLFDFNPRAPCGARLAASVDVSSIDEFQSTRPVRGATLEQAGLECVLGISIHAPRAGRDSPWGWDRPCQRISIHAPRAGRDVHVRGALLLHEAFQSTRPVRGATAWDADQRKERYDFNPRAPCGARQPPRAAWRGGSRDFNPRAPCGARQPQKNHRRRPDYAHFNPRAPCGARRKLKIDLDKLIDFNPRAPCGARLCDTCTSFNQSAFQSTRPVRGATVA